MKTSSIQLKHCNLHHKWSHHETNKNSWVLWVLLWWITFFTNYVVPESIHTLPPPMERIKKWGGGVSKAQKLQSGRGLYKLFCLFLCIYLPQPGTQKYYFFCCQKKVIFSSLGSIFVATWVQHVVESRQVNPLNYSRLNVCHYKLCVCRQTFTSRFVAICQ